MTDDAAALLATRRHPRRRRGVPRRRGRRARRARVACFDNDGTLWCERPTYVQLDFFVDALKAAVARGPERRRRRRSSRRCSSGDQAAIGELGLERIALRADRAVRGALAGGVHRARARRSWPAPHPTLGRPLRTNTYLPMLELIDELRRRDFTVCVVTGGGTEFVRAISQDLYGVPPEAVVGTPDRLRLRADRRRRHRPVAAAHRRPRRRRQRGRRQGRPTSRPSSAAARSSRPATPAATGRCSSGRPPATDPTLALLVDHDDAEREFAYVSTAETFAEPEPITDVGARLGWTVVSMASDWATVFGPLQ